MLLVLLVLVTHLTSGEPHQIHTHVPIEILGTIAIGTEGLKS